MTMRPEPYTALHAPYLLFMEYLQCLSIFCDLLFRAVKGDRRGFSLSSKLRSSFKGSCNSLKDMDATVSPSSTPVGFFPFAQWELLPLTAVIANYWVIFTDILAFC